MAPVEQVLSAAVGDDHRRRLDVLEAAAAGLGGCDIATLRGSDDQGRVLSVDNAIAFGDLVRSALPRVPMHPAFALASLAQPTQSLADRRRDGAYYTDFRLARFLFERLPCEFGPDDLTLDPASGTGMLLVAAALQFASESDALDHFIAHSICAADLSVDALRGARLALASLTSDDRSVELLSTRLRRLDSLVAGPAAWSDIAPDGFAVVAGNPPWEKLKLSRHEHLVAGGVERHYGADYHEDLNGLGDARARMTEYVRDLSQIYASAGTGEADLYRLFLALSMRLAAPVGGQLAMLVPAGLIRALGTEAMRRDLFSRGSKLHLTVLENRPRYFGIDSRFKFLAVHTLLGESNRSALMVDHADADAKKVSVVSSATLGRSKLKRLRPDLTVPEVRSSIEWRIYQTMAAAGAPLGDLSADWPLDIVRELDMTNDRRLLLRARQDGAIPLIEGRMVHQFRCGHKAYVSGSGRAARWRVTDRNESELVPQFWVDPANLSSRRLERAEEDRIGFCDITGQTNERTMLAARIPAGAMCGNKVPTITFADHHSPADAADLWLAVVNSFAFDWLLRRLATTTVNYFVLRSVPFPSISSTDDDGRRLIEHSRLLTEAGAKETMEELADLRAEIDALVFRAYGLDLDEARIVLDDFPLLDRGQPAIGDEARSTITRDLVLARLAWLLDTDEPASRQRLDEALAGGAVGYIPAQASAGRVEALVAAIG